MDPVTYVKDLSRTCSATLADWCQRVASPMLAVLTELLAAAGAIRPWLTPVLVPARAAYRSRPRLRRLWLVLGLLALGGTSRIPAARATTQPEVQFDVNNTLGCRDVTPASFRELNPEEKLVEAKFQVSAFLNRGSEDDLLQFVYDVVSTRRTMRIIDYWPKTTLATDLAGNIAIEDKQEQDQHVGLSLATPTNASLKFGTTGDLGTKEQHSLKYEMLPHMLPVSASGTRDRGYGVYFKLKPSRRSSLEGAKEFTLVFRVAKLWRGDFVQLSCHALGTRRSVMPPLSETLPCGEHRFTLALYVEGDAEAKALAQRLVQAEAQLLRTVSANRQAIEKRLYPTLAHKLGVLEPRLPTNWAEQVLADPRAAAVAGDVSRLPPAVQQAVSAYALARRELNQLGSSIQFQ